jgi:hypothetical protein
MGNMSYCRFENTSRDLGDCLDAIENGQTNDLSAYETSGLRDLLDYCEAILEYKEEIYEKINE